MLGIGAGDTVDRAELTHAIRGAERAEAIDAGIADVSRLIPSSLLRMTTAMSSRRWLLCGSPAGGTSAIRDSVPSLRLPVYPVTPI
jgi:hypothetical protein